MKRLHLLPLALALAGILSGNCLAAEFPDVPETHWASAYVDKLSDEGVILGRTDGNFDPDDTVSRAEFLALVARTVSDAPLRDAADGESWWQPAYDYAVNENLLDYGTLFDDTALDTAITRYEAAEILYESSCNILEDTNGLADTTQLTDLSGSYDYAVTAAVRYGLLTGYPDGTFRGNGTLTRAEAAVIITRLQARDALADGDRFVAAWGDTWLVQNVTRAGTTLKLIDMVSGETRQTIAMDMDMEPPADSEFYTTPTEEDLDGFYAYRLYFQTLSQLDGDLVYGTAGLYRYENGRLTQLADTPVAAVTADGDGYLLVTCDKGERTFYTGAAINYLCGDRVLRWQDGATTTLLDNAAGLNLSNVYRGTDGSVYVDHTFVMGMADTWRYCYRLDNGRLTAMATVGGNGYSPRTEAEAATEQARLDAVYGE
jgi:hypothetical protein